jgi:CRISPR-associated endonuclease/helicase Cas3
VSGAGLAWGKLNRAHPHQQHPLTDHMLDVAACLLALLRCPGIHRALCQSGGLQQLDDIQMQRLGALAFLHDLGKANAGFQGKRWPAGQRPPGWPGAHGHVAEAFDVFQSDVLSAALPLDAVFRWGSDAAVTQLLYASISHHGRPAQPRVESDPTIWRDIPASAGCPQGYRPVQTLADIGARLQRGFPLAFTASGAALPDTPAFAHLFAGLVQLADWLGSDTRFFPFSEPGEDRQTHARERAAQAIHTLGLDAQWQARLRQHPLSFPEAFGVPEPRPLQAVMGAAHLGPLLILEAETGSGKTEAALWRFLHLARAEQVDALYFALPTRVAATQLYQRLCECVARLWPDEAQRPVVVRALSGYTHAEGADMVRLPGFEVHWSDEPADGVAHRRWAAESPKRFLAAPIAVGTIDQVLLGALQVRHAHLRHAMLSRSLLVVDEVHASDAYMTRLLTHLLQAHLRTGGQALLLSATLGSVARSQFQALVTPSASPKRPAMPDVQSACALPYPALSDGSQWHPLAGTGHSKTVRWQLLDVIDAPERIATLALEAARQGARVLVVRNTVPAAVATFRAVEAAGGGDVLLDVAGQRTLHHSRFSPADRPLIDAAVQGQIGKLRPVQPSGRIVIGTQTLEQSLDLDADVLITDLCPMDVLLQRLGRLHRHARPASERPAAFQQAQAWVLTPAGNTLVSCLSRPRHGLGRFHQGGGVYADVRVLEATRQLIAAQPERQIPQDNRYLVEMATHPQRLDAIAQTGGAAWLKHGQQIEGELSAQDAIAKLHGLPFGQMFDQGLSFPAQDEQRVTTRLGAGDWLLSFEPPVPGPFGQPLTRLNIRPHLLPAGLTDGETAQQVQALPDGGVECLAGGARWRYDRMGLQKLKP